MNNKYFVSKATIAGKQASPLANIQGNGPLF